MMMMKPNNSLQKPLGNRKPVAASVSGEDCNRLGWKVLMLLFALGVVFYTLFGGAISAPAQGTAFTYQGHLSDTGQTANGSYDLTFALFGSDSGGMAVADTLTNSPTTVSNGLFTVVLDFGANVFNGQPRWLEIAVRTNGSTESYTTLSPRQELTATPYAITASSLSGTLPASQLSGSLPFNALTGVYSNAVTFNNPTNSFVGAFSGDGSGLTDLPAAQLTGGLPTNALTGTYPNAVAFSNPTNTFVGTFSGDGSGLTNLPAAQLTGTLPTNALTGTYPNAVTFNNPTNTFAGSFAGAFSGDGCGLTNLNIAQLSGAHLTILLMGTYTNAVTFNNPTNTFAGSFAGAFSGDGSGLTNLSVSQLSGTLPTNGLMGSYPNAVTFNNPTNSFVGAFSGDGSGLTNLSAVQLTGALPANALSGTYPDAVTLNNPTNVFVGTFSGNGSGLTNLNAANLVNGKIDDARLSSNVALLNSSQFFTGANTFAGATTLTNIGNQVSGTFNGTLYGNLFGNAFGNLFGNVFGDGSGLTGLSASQLSAGTLSDARLSVNVALLSTNQLFSGTNVFSNSGNNFSGTFTGSFSGDGSGLTNVNLGSTQPPPAVTPGLTMVWIKPGTFVMGSPTGEVDRIDFYEGPQTVVTLTRGFWMGQHLVTQGEYVTVVGSNPSYFTGDLNLPVESVTWSDATNYCSLLTQSERSAGRLPANWVYRLPTNAEWEYACRALTTTRTYWGDDPGYTNMVNQAWYEANSNNQTHPVGQKPPNPWGLSDMQGNLWQWCQDWFEVYPGGSVTDPQGPTSSSWGTRVGRGGSWWDEPTWLRSAARYDFPPDNPNYRQMMGFRVVLAPSP